jgi:hypothetical protein
MLRFLSVNGFSLTRLRPDIWRFTGFRGIKLRAGCGHWASIGIAPNLYVCRTLSVCSRPAAPATISAKTLP